MSQWRQLEKEALGLGYQGFTDWESLRALSEINSPRLWEDHFKIQMPQGTFDSEMCRGPAPGEGLVRFLQKTMEVSKAPSPKAGWVQGSPRYSLQELIQMFCYSLKAFSRPHRTHGSPDVWFGQGTPRGSLPLVTTGEGFGLG